MSRLYFYFTSLIVTSFIPDLKQSTQSIFCASLGVVSPSCGCSRYCSLNSSFHFLSQTPKIILVFEHPTWTVDVYRHFNLKWLHWGHLWFSPWTILLLPVIRVFELLSLTLIRFYAINQCCCCYIFDFYQPYCKSQEENRLAVLRPTNIYIFKGGLY